MATQISVDLPDQLAEFVRTRVASGRYASASDVIQEGLRALADRDDPEFDEAVEHWLKTEVAGAYDRWKAGRLRARSIDDVQAMLDQEHHRATREA